MKARESEFQSTPGSVGDPPDWFSADALDEWNRITGDKGYREQVLSPLHRSTLIEYCILYGRMIEEAKGTGKLSASERQTLNSLRMQLGITPASQAKVNVRPSAPAKDEWAELDGMGLVGSRGA